MRMMIQFSIPVEAGNQAARKGTLGAPFEKVLAELKPEAAYFTATEHVERGGVIVFDLKDTSQLPAIVELFFLIYNASINFSPAISAQAVPAAIPGIDRVDKAERS